jgi:hypothetical protein
LGCINPDHLRWATAKENREDALAHGVLPFGEKVGTSKLNPEKVRELRRLHSQGVRVNRLARQFGLSWHGTKAIVDRRVWRQVT